MGILTHFTFSSLVFGQKRIWSNSVVISRQDVYYYFQLLGLINVNIITITISIKRAQICSMKRIRGMHHLCFIDLDPSYCQSLSLWLSAYEVIWLSFAFKMYICIHTYHWLAIVVIITTTLVVCRRAEWLAIYSSGFLSHRSNSWRVQNSQRNKFAPNLNISKVRLRVRRWSLI